MCLLINFLCLLCPYVLDKLAPLYKLNKNLLLLTVLIYHATVKLFIIIMQQRTRSEVNVLGVFSNQ